MSDDLKTQVKGNDMKTLLIATAAAFIFVGTQPVRSESVCTKSIYETKFGKRVKRCLEWKERDTNGSDSGSNDEYFTENPPSGDDYLTPDESDKLDNEAYGDAENQRLDY